MSCAPGSRRSPDAAKRLAAEHLVNQRLQALRVVDVVPDRELEYGKSEGLRPRNRLREDSVRAPGDVLEQRYMWALHADQVVSPIGGWPKHNAIAGSRQRSRRRHEITDGQGWTVGIQQANATMACAQQGKRCVLQAFTQRGRYGLEQPDALGQMGSEERLGAGRRVSHPAADVGERGGRQDVVGGITQE